MKERIGKKVRVVLPKEIFYNGTILDEDQNTITIKDKYNKRIEIGKTYIMTLEVVD